MSVKLDIDVRKSVSGFDLHVSQVMDVSGVTAVFGPSGAGKTTLLRLIAGFESPDSGHIRVNDELWDMPPHQRRAGYVFQDSRLFPHLTVKGNLDFARVRGIDKGARFGIDAIIEAFDLEDLLERRPASLSGGERKRAALGRTLLTRPKLLLLDEPLSGLDRGRKRDILPFIESLPERFGLPCLYVSHDMEEVSHLADDILVLNAGRVEGYGAAMDIMGRLDLEPLTGQSDPSTRLEGKVSRQDKRLLLTTVKVGQAVFSLPIKQSLQVGDNIRLRVKAKDVSIATARPQGLSIRNILPATILDITSGSPHGFSDITLDIGGAYLRSRITLAAKEELGIRPGLEVFALVKSMSFEGRLYSD